MEKLPSIHLATCRPVTQCGGIFPAMAASCIAAVRACSSSTLRRHSRLGLGLLPSPARLTVIGSPRRLVCSHSAARAAMDPAAPAAAEPAAAPPAVGEIDALEIRVGKIVKAWKHPDADSLYVEEVDMAEESGNRTICSGLVNYVPEDELQGKLVAVLANLKPRNMKGIKSNGMLLAASDKAHENVELVVPPEGSSRGCQIVPSSCCYSKSALPLQVYCSNPAAVQLTSSLPEEYQSKFLSINVVKSGETLNLGNGHELQFILTPTPRWPDGMCTYDVSSQLLFSQKLFSAHICTDTDFDTGGWEVFGEHWRYFYDCMLGPVSKQADAALRKLPIVAQFSPPSYAGKAGIDVIKADIKFLLSGLLSALNLPISASAALSKTTIDSNKELVVSAICPMHGPVVRSSVTELVREYRIWTQDKVKQIEDGLVAVIYASAYGNTAALAQAISRGISKSGLGVESLNTELCGIDEVTALVGRSDAFAGHMPTPIQNALGAILRDTTARSKPCGVFGSFGWSGEAVDEMEQRLKDSGFSFAFPAIRCIFFKYFLLF